MSKRAEILKFTKSIHCYRYAISIVTMFALAVGTLVLFAPQKVAGQAEHAWPMFHGNAKMTGQSQYDTSKVTGSVKWKFKTSSGVESSPVIDKNGTIYIADQSCLLYAVNPDGTKKWEFKAGDPITSKEWGGWPSCMQATPALGADGTIYILPMSGNFYAVNPDGTEKWRYPVFTFKNAWPSPTVGPDGTIYVGSESYPPRETGKPQERSAYFYAFNPNGTLKWQYESVGASWVNPNATIATDGTIYVPSNDCKNNCQNTLFAFNPNGTIKWKFAPPNGVMEGSVALGDDDTLYFTAKGKQDPRQANFYALTPAGTVKWKFQLKNGVSITPAISKDGKIYFGDWGGIFYALDLNGKELWRVQTPPAYESLSSSPAIGADGTVYFGTIAQYFYAYNPDGTEKWKINVGEAGIVSSPAIGADGTVYFASVRGELYALGAGPATSNQPATSASMSNAKPSRLIMAALALMIGILAVAAVVFAVLLWKRASLQGRPLAVYAFISRHRWIVLPAYALLLLGASTLLIIVATPESKPAPSSPAPQEPPMTVPQINKKAVCPRRVYGHPNSGFYGVYDMQQIDMTTDEYNWARNNCPNTTWTDN